VLFRSARVRPGVSDALVSQVDFLATLAALTGQQLAAADAPDSLDQTPALLGDSPRGRDYVIEHSNKLALREGSWKFIAPAGVEAVAKFAGSQTANLPAPQLYDLANDPGETKNLAAIEPARTAAMAARLAALKITPRTRP